MTTLKSYLDNLTVTRPEDNRAKLTTLLFFDSVYSIDYFEVDERENDFDCLSMLKFKILIK